ncbi:MAG: rod shape-determining protein MreD [Pseudomonadota bacterium]
MNPSLLQRLDRGLRSAVPGLSTLIFTLLGVVPLHLPVYGPISPLLALIPIYYWAVHRPDLMTFSLAFAIGLVHDALAGAPLGVHSLVYLLCYWAAFSQRRFLAGKGFFVLWWGMLLIAALGVGLEWLVFSVFYARLMPVEPLAFRALLTTALFPLVGGLMIQIHRLMLFQPRSWRA